MAQSWGAGRRAKAVNGGLRRTCLWMVAPSTDLGKKHFSNWFRFSSEDLTLTEELSPISASLLLRCLLPLQDNNHLGSQFLFCP